MRTTIGWTCPVCDPYDDNDNAVTYTRRVAHVQRRPEKFVVCIPWDSSFAECDDRRKHTISEELEIV